MEPKSWFNLEKSIFLGFTLLLVFLAADYLRTRPGPIREALIEPSTKLQPGSLKRPAARKHIRFTGSPVVTTKRGDVFVHPELLAHQRYRLNPPTVHKPRPIPTPGPLVTKVKLPRKPSNDPDPLDPPVEDPVKKKEPPFPLLAKGFVQMEDRPGAWQVLLTPRADPGNYRKLRVGDEYDIDGENIKVVEITPESVTFERGDGRIHKIDKDPLKTPSAIPGDEATREPGEEPPPPLGADPLNPGFGNKNPELMNKLSGID